MRDGTLNTLMNVSISDPEHLGNEDTRKRELRSNRNKESTNSGWWSSDECDGIRGFVKRRRRYERWWMGTCFVAWDYDWKL